MALDYDNQEQLDDSVFPVNLDENAELDRYGVWIKQSPKDKDQEIDNHEDDLESIEIDDSFDIDESDAVVPDLNDTVEETEEVIEFDDIEEFTQMPAMDLSESDESLEINEFETDLNSEDEISNIEEPVEETIVQETEETEEDMGMDEFETLDLDDFLSDDGPSADTKKDEEEQAVESVEIDDESVSISTDVNEIEETSEFDDLLSGLDEGSDESGVVGSTVEKDENSAIDMNITIDEESDISAIAGKSSSDDENLDNIAIFGDDAPPKAKEETVKPAETPSAAQDEDDLIIESTIIEADNKEAIREENEKILNESSEKPRVEDDDELNSLDSMLDDLMGIDSASSSTSSEVNETVEMETPSFEMPSVEEVSDNEVETSSPFDVDEEIDFNTGAGLDLSENDESIDFDIEEANFDIEEANLDMPENIEITDDAISEDIISENTDIEVDNAGDNADNNEDIFFDDIGALENDMLDDGPVSDDEPVSISDETPASETNLEIDNVAADVSQNIAKASDNSDLQNDKATEILMQIAGELSSIKSELSNLKSGMANKETALQTSFAPESLVEPLPDPVEKTESQASAADDENSGFFSDDDSDETIALTGDELNNILITADFTEKQADDFESEDSGIPQDLGMDNNDSSESDDFADSDFDIPEVLDESMTVTGDGAEAVPPVDAVPRENINTIEDDISYLDEEDDEVIDDKPEDYIDIPDFNDENIEEPNLDNFDLTIKELELPNGQSVTLGEPDENINAIDTDEFDSISFDDGIIENENDFADVEANISDEEEIFDANELESAADDIPHLDLETDTAEKHKLDLPEGSEEKAFAIPPMPGAPAAGKDGETLPIHLKEEIKSVLSYMDQLLESLPENKIEEFAKSEYFDTYKRLFDELGI